MLNENPDSWLTLTSKEVKAGAGRRAGASKDKPIP